jgi:F-type H+-transporting ATPase subunit gamma
MAGTKEIKQRIKSVKNTKKITKAMELVAASKMKRAVSRAVASRLYSGYSWDLLQSLSNGVNELKHPFFGNVAPEEGDTEAPKKDLIILITSNSGLCGAYNAQAIKAATTLLKSMGGIDMEANTIDMITVGKKGDAVMRRLGPSIIATFVDIPDNSTLADISPLTKLIIDEYKKGSYRGVYVTYTDFVSALTQKATIKKLLPISKDELKNFIEEVGEQSKEQGDVLDEKFKNTEYTFEGDMNRLIESLAEKITRMQVYQMILESSASEQSSRMLAMKNASDAAGEMIQDLTLVFNKARQAGITQEISEISAGMASLS